MDLDEVLLEAEEAMDKAVEYTRSELRGVRTGRASTGLVEFVKVDYYGSQSDLRQLAIISTPDPSTIVIKPFDASSIQEIIKAIQTSGLGLNPMADGKQIRLNIPPLTGERRSRLVNSVRQMGEQGKVTLRNARRDANKQIDQAGKDKTLHISEDQVEDAKKEIQDLLKKYETGVDDLVNQKVKEIQEV